MACLRDTDWEDALCFEVRLGQEILSPSGHLLTKWHKQCLRRSLADELHTLIGV